MVHVCGSWKSSSGASRSSSIATILCFFVTFVLLWASKHSGHKNCAHCLQRCFACFVLLLHSWQVMSGFFLWTFKWSIRYCLVSSIRKSPTSPLGTLWRISHVGHLISPRNAVDSKHEMQMAWRHGSIRGSCMSSSYSFMHDEHSTYCWRTSSGCTGALLKLAIEL